MIGRRAIWKTQERMTAQAVLALLLSEGHAVADMRAPKQGDGRSPDFLLELDGETMALEVTRYLGPAAVQKAASRVELVERAVGDLLREDAREAGGKLVVDIRYAVEALQSHRRADVSRDAEVIARAVRRARRATQANPSTSVPVDTGLPWVTSMTVAVLVSPEPGAYFGTSPGFPDAAVDADDFIARTIEAKAGQHLGHASRAILAVQGMFRDDAENLAEAVRRYSDTVPWWRVYFVRGDAFLVYEGPS